MKNKLIIAILIVAFVAMAPSAMATDTMAGRNLTTLNYGEVPYHGGVTEEHLVDFHRGTSIEAGAGQIITDIRVYVKDVEDWTGAQINFTMTLTNGQTLSGSIVNNGDGTAIRRLNGLQETDTVSYYHEVQDYITDNPGDLWFTLGYAVDRTSGTPTHFTDIGVFLWLTNVTVDKIGTYDVGIKKIQFMSTDGLMITVKYFAWDQATWIEQNHYEGAKTATGEVDALSAVRDAIGDLVGGLLNMLVWALTVVMFFAGIASFIFNPWNLLMMAALYIACTAAYASWKAKNFFDFFGQWVNANIKAMNIVVGITEALITILSITISALSAAADIFIRIGTTALQIASNLIGTIGTILIFK
jgi:hypothetical protein